jgi:hypothetical protein
MIRCRVVEVCLTVCILSNPGVPISCPEAIGASARESQMVPIMTFMKVAQERHAHEAVVKVWTEATFESRAIYILTIVSQRKSTPTND